jgi:hypothetical protein
VGSSTKVRVVGCLVALFSAACVAFGLNLLIGDSDLSQGDKDLIGGIPLVLGLVGLYSGVSVTRSGRL